MVAIFAGQGSGLQKGSAAVLGAAGLLGNAGMGRSGGSVFVNAANGNLVLSQSDAMLVGRGTDIDAGRSYNRTIDSADRAGLAQNWRFNQKRIDTAQALDQTGSLLKLVDTDGSATIYTWDGSGYVSSDGAGSYDRFARNSSGWVRTDGDTRAQERYYATYGGFSVLTQIVDASGNTTTYTYNAAGQIARITAVDGGYVEYGYSGTDSKVRSAKLVYTDLATSQQKTQTIVYAYTGDNLSSATIDLTPEDGSTADGRVYAQTYTYLPRHVDVRPLDPALHQCAGAVRSRLDLVQPGPVRHPEQPAVERLERGGIARHDDHDAADFALPARRIGRDQCAVAGDRDLARPRRHADRGAERQAAARGDQRAVLAEREPAATPQQDLPVRPQQFDKAATPDREVHRLPRRLDRPALVHRHRGGGGHPRGGEDRVRHRGRHLHVAALRQHRGETDVGALERRRIHVGDVVRHDVERALLRLEPDRADMERAVHRDACPKVVTARPSRSSHTWNTRPPASAWRSATIMPVICPLMSTVDASTMPCRIVGDATGSASATVNNVPSIAAGAAPAGAA